ncbi:MAG: hypothetical protein LUC43_01130 [Burkholderiales bacterium]|nr:hypothetical protein [Burkholderiales bacterium]
MKILSATFSNLAPFKGTWKIDFTDPAYAQNPFFVFFSDSPALSTAISDAISLALFGTTYDLHNEEKTATAPFTDPSKKLWSKVVFSVGNATYTAQWTAEPNKKLADGQVKLMDGNGVNLLKVGEGAKLAIHKIIGTTYSGFTKLFCLAPAKFGEFLPSPSDLKQIMHTHIWDNSLLPLLPSLTSNIARQKKTAADVSKRMVEACHYLSREEEAQLFRNLKSSQDRINSLKKITTDSEVAIAWLQTMGSLKEELQKLGKEEAALKDSLARFDIKRPVLQSANNAVKLVNSYNNLKEVREKLADAQKKLAEGRTKVSPLQKRAQLAQTNLADKSSLYRKAENIWTTKKDLLGKVRAIDEKLVELTNSATAKAAQFEKAESDQKATAETCQELKKDISQSKNAKSFIYKKLNELGADEKFASDIQTCQIKLNEIDRLSAEIAETAKTQKTAQITLEKARSDHQENETHLSSLKKRLLFLETDIGLKTRSLAKLLGKTASASLEKDIETFSAKAEGVQKLEQLCEKIAKMSEQEQLEKNLLNKNYHELKIANTELNSAAQILRDKKTIAQNCKEILDFQNKVASLESYRKELANGKPCPLCGAIHHPYVSSTPSAVAAEEKLKHAQKEAELASAAYQEAQTKCHRLSAVVQTSEQTIKESEQRIDQMKSAILAMAEALEISGLKEKKLLSWAMIIRQKMTVAKNKVEESQSKLTQYTSLTTVIRESEEELEKVRSEVDALTDKNATTLHIIGETTQELQQLSQSEVQNVRHRDDLIKELERFFSKHGIKATTPSMLKQQFPILLNKKTAWEEMTHELAAIGVHLTQSEETLTKASERLRDETALVQQLGIDISRLDAEIKILSKDRADLMGTQNLSDYENQAIRELDAAKEAFEDATAFESERRLELQACEQSIASDEADTNNLASKTAELENSFMQALQTAGFISEAQFLSSRISEVQRLELQAENDSLTQHLTDLMARKSAKEAEYLAEEQKHLTGMTLGEAREAYEKTKADLAEALKLEQTYSEELEQNNFAKQRFLRENEDYEKKRLESEHWDTLLQAVNDTPNSSNLDREIDLGFELLVEYASGHLRLVNPRYVLQRNIENPYELMLVYDQNYNYPKTTSDFTPSESFLVSLSLCLALQQLESMKCPCDFVLVQSSPASLDAASKEALMSTVFRLNQQGKIVGVVTPNSEDENLSPVRIITDELNHGGSQLRGNSVVQVLG